MKATHRMLSACLFLILTMSSLSYAQDCEPEINYHPIKGRYTKQLGTSDIQLNQMLQRLAQQSDKYCQLKASIRFVENLETKQLVHKSEKENQHYFLIEYQTPIYTVEIRSRDGEMLHQMTYGEGSSFTPFPLSGKMRSKDALFKQWNLSRTKEYTKLEQASNEYIPLKNFLSQLIVDSFQEASIAVVEEPEPIETPLESEPIEVPQESELIETPQEPEPIEAPQEPEPIETPQESEPIETPQESELIETPQESEPTETPLESEPIEAPQEPEPIEAPQEPEPIETPQESELIETPQESEPIETPQESELIETPQESEPIETPLESEPIEAPQEPEPIETPLESEPIEAPQEPESIEAPQELKENPQTEISDEVKRSSNDLASQGPSVAQNSKSKAKKNNKRKNPTNPINSDTDNYKEKLDREKALPPLHDLVSLDFCSELSLIIRNPSYFTLQVEIGNDKEINTQKYTISGEEEAMIDLPVKKGNWYKVHYPELLHNRDIKKFNVIIGQIYEDMRVVDAGVKVMQTINELSPPSPPLTYDGSRDEYYYDYAAAENEQAFYDVAMELGNMFSQSQGQGQVNLFTALMFESFFLHEYYLQEKKKGLSPFYLNQHPDYKSKYPKNRTPIIGFQASIFAPAISEGVFNDSWDSRTPNYTGELHIGLPFEKSSGKPGQRWFSRPYLIAGYQQANLKLNASTAFVGASYVENGELGQTYQLSTIEGIKLRTHSAHLGLAYRSFNKKGQYITIAGGVRKIWQSELAFDKKKDYFVNQNRSFNKEALKGIVEDQSIAPYAQLTVGILMGNDPRVKGMKCDPKFRELDLFFTGMFGFWQPQPTDNYQLYESNNAQNLIPTEGNDKWFFYIGMGLGYFL